jgi:hypothetical protein
VILPLLPSASSVQRSLSETQAQNGNSQSKLGGSNSISPFTPALPWITAMEFSERVALSDLLPLTSNATLNTSANTQSGSAFGSAGASASNSAQRFSGGSNFNVPLNASGNLVGARPFSYVNVTDLDRQLSRRGMVTVMTVYMADGTTISSFNITNGTDSDQAGNQGKPLTACTEPLLGATSLRTCLFPKAQCLSDLVHTHIRSHVHSINAQVADVPY